MNIVIFENIWSLIKQQFKQFDSWAMFGLLAFLMNLGIVVGLMLCMLPILLVSGLFGGAFAVVGVLGYVLAGLVTCALVLYILSKSMGFFNVWWVNALDVAQGKTPRRFEHKISGLKYMGFGFVWFLIIAVGFLCLVIPGIIFWARFSVAYFVMLDTNCSIIQALQRSWDLTQKYFWESFLVMFVCAVVAMIPFIWIVLVLFPCNLFAVASLYEQLKQQKLTENKVSV